MGYSLNNLAPEPNCSKGISILNRWPGRGKGLVGNSIAVPLRAARNRCEVLDRAV
ncbi:hypothetical protein PISMIDRAFT_674996, partial [Pisolithus microcarpus 441]